MKAAPTAAPAWRRRLFTDDERLLAALCRITPAVPGEADPPGTTTPPAALVEQAMKEGLGPLLYRAIREGEAGTRQLPSTFAGLDEGARAALRRTTLAEGLSQAIRLERLATILAELEAQGIPVVLYKGAAYVEQIYPEPALRPMSDLDLLVPGSRIAEATRCLEGLGYSVLLPLGAFGVPFETCLRAPAGWPTVDLHVHVSRARQTRITADELIVRSHPRGSGPGRVFGPVESLLLHALHQVVPTQLLATLQTFVDLRELVLRARPRWDEVVALARAWGLEGVLSAALAALDSLFPGLLLPEERLRPTVGVTALLRLRTRWRITQPRPALDYRLRHLVKLALVDRWSDRAGLLAELAGEAGARLTRRARRPAGAS